ncbi:BRO family protein [Erwiniaceae bacterium L1_54_6]|nr:BRO family protein [Erwiniaceae bacterium L1_54_6]
MKIIAKEKSEFTIFRFGDSEIRVIDKAGEPWFVAEDVCSALQLSNPTMSMKALDEEERSKFNLGRQGEANIVSESGMYTLVLRCRDAVNKGSVPHAFRKWVTAEVLPAIRKQGVYEKPKVITKKASVEDRTPLRDAVNLLVSKKHMMYPEAYALIHKQFEVRSIEDLTSEQIPLAVEYVHTVILEGELLGKEVGQLKLPFSYPMEYFNQYRHIRGMSENALSAPWRYPADMLVPNGDNPNPLGRMLGELKNMGLEVDAALFQLLSLQHHLESLRSKISSIQRAVM